LLQRYEKKVASGQLERDGAQRAAAERLQTLGDELVEWRRALQGGFSLFRRRAGPAPRGLYLHGGVGRGKTMLMDLFFENAAFRPKRRLHFHEFMAEVHERIARGRATTDGDPIPFVAAEIAGDAGLLCFDEFHVTDIADAMILGRLFRVLFERQVIVVATSNTPPSGLYRNGLNRQLFVPFIAMLEEHMNVLELKSAKDFRLEKLAGRPLYFTPADERARAELDGHWQRLTAGEPAAPVDLTVLGRKLQVPLASMGVARFEFPDLCEKALGANDYLGIAHAFHTVLIDGIPVLTAARRNEARRFITLIDAFYDAKVGLIVSADAEPNALYPSGDGSDLFERTASRLVEMRSAAYREARGNRAGAGAP